MDALAKAAYEAVSAAVKDKPVGKGSLAEVSAADVAMLADLVSLPCDVVDALKLGARGALVGLKPDDIMLVHQQADKLRHMLERIPVTSEPAR